MTREGIYVASLTPLKANYAIAHRAFAEHVKWLLQRGSDGVVLFGTTGEASSFSTIQRMSALEAVCEQQVPPDRLIVGTGTTALADTVALTSHALAQGVKHVLVLPPFYYTPISDAGLLTYFETLIHHVNNPEMRILLYHIPQLTGVGFSSTLIRRLCEEFPDQIVGIKDSSGDWHHMAEWVRDFPDLKIYSGTETYLLDIMQAGGAGCISATLNVSSPIAANLFRHRRSHQAMEEQQQLSKIRMAITNYPVVPALKGIMHTWTLESYWNRLCPPLMPLPSEDIYGLLRTLPASLQRKSGS